MLELAKKIRRGIYTAVGFGPMQKVMRRLSRLGFRKFEHGLEVFGFEGWYHTIHYAQRVQHLEVWEIDPDCEAPLKKNLPEAKIVIGDSYMLIRSSDRLYDLIVVDNQESLAGNERCEHFEIFDDCLARLKARGVLITNVIPKMDARARDTSAYRLHLEKRNTYYGVDVSDELSEEFLLGFYTQKVLAAGYTTNHGFMVRRNYLMCYMVLCVEKVG